MPKAVNIQGLSREAKNYNNVLKELPFWKLNEICKLLKLNILKVKGEDIRINKRRKADFIRPYVPGLTLGQASELAKFDEFKLKPELVYAELFENITEYKDKNVLSNQGEWLDNQSKKHPLEFLILKDLVISFGEDVIFNLFFAERDAATASAKTAFTGFFPKLDILVAAGEISAAKKNLVATGAFDLPDDGDDTKSYDKLVDFVKAGHPLLRERSTLLYAAEKPIDAALKAYANIVKSHQYPTVDQMLASVRNDARCPNLQLLTHSCLGTGDRLMMLDQTASLLDIGVNNESDSDFVQVRSISKDPNEVQYWIQAAYDTRIGDVHPKVFLTNDQVNTANSFAGDY